MRFQCCCMLLLALFFNFCFSEDNELCWLGIVISIFGDVSGSVMVKWMLLMFYALQFVAILFVPLIKLLINQSCLNKE